uniref:uncharacterized protein LOC105350921 isoform X2 n=1 Tax=Fragaria vesca subsp. vesca TaxID=101020 RepID=UPI0005C99CC7|nr:PREDICTED: uncharacterized protein LOC105350921 isoform X2 [Fragaria vesca subsp. vesca]
MAVFLFFRRAPAATAIVRVGFFSSFLLLPSYVFNLLIRALIGGTPFLLFLGFHGVSPATEFLPFPASSPCSDEQGYFLADPAAEWRRWLGFGSRWGSSGRDSERQRAAGRSPARRSFWVRVLSGLKNLVF